jgi:hypothetical protein
MVQIGEEKRDKLQQKGWRLFPVNRHVTPAGSRSVGFGKFEPS